MIPRQAINSPPTVPVATAFAAQEWMRFRHVVFADAVRPIGDNKPVDFSPRVSTPDDSRTARSPDALPEAMSPEHAGFFRWLLGQAQLDAAVYRPESLARRTAACLRALRVSGVAQARRRLGDDPSLIPAAVDSVLIGVTSFFRDAYVFDEIERSILPNLIGDCEKEGRPLRVWSVGCSDGAELYSLAIQLDEAGWLERSKLLGTDCRSDAIARAEAGAFDEASLRDVSPLRQARYFQRELSSRRSVITPDVRRCVAWRVADALCHQTSCAGESSANQVDEQTGWHMILCRNMAMYMKPECAARLWRRLENALAPGGVLVLGKAERPYGATKRLSPIAPCVYRRERE